MRRINVIILLALVLLFQRSAIADDGFLIRTNVLQVNSPVANQTVLYDMSDHCLKYWDGTNWIRLNIQPSNYNGSGPPSTSNDNTQGYAPGSLWLDTTDGQAYVCVDATTGAAVWYQVSSRIGSNDVQSKLTTGDVYSDWVISGLLGSVPVSSLSMTTPSGFAEVDGLRIGAGPFNFTYPVSQDTYEYLQTDGSILRVSVGNGSPAPIGQPGLNLQKVVTNGTQITAVTQLAITLPQLSISPAINNNQAITLGQANGLYAPQAWFSSGTLTPAHGGLGANSIPSASQVPVGDGSGNYTPTTLISSDGSVGVAPGSGTLDLTSISRSGNLLINGGFDLWEKSAWDGVSAGVTYGDNVYSGANRWCIATDGTFVDAIPANGNGGTIAGTGMKSYYQASLTSDGHAGLFQILESCDSVPLANRTVTFQCALASQQVPQNFRIAILAYQGTPDFGGGIRAHTYPVANWSSTTYDNLPGHFFSSGTVPVAVSSSFVCSTSYQFQTFSITGTMPSSVSNVYVMVWTENSITGGGNAVMVGECCLSISPSAVTYTPPNIALETLKAHRYYQRFVDHTTFPPSGCGDGLIHFHSPDPITGGVAGRILYGFNFEPMRKIPAAAFRGPTTGATGSNGQIYDVSTGQTVTNITPGGLTENRFEYFNVGTSNISNIALNDELMTAIEFDSEL